MGFDWNMKEKMRGVVFLTFEKRRLSLVGLRGCLLELLNGVFWSTVIHSCFYWDQVVSTFSRNTRTFQKIVCSSQTFSRGVTDNQRHFRGSIIKPGALVDQVIFDSWHLTTVQLIGYASLLSHLRFSFHATLVLLHISTQLMGPPVFWAGRKMYPLLSRTVRSPLIMFQLTVTQWVISACRSALLVWCRVKGQTLRGLMPIRLCINMCGRSIEQVVSMFTSAFGKNGEKRTWMLQIQALVLVFWCLFTKCVH